MAPLPPALAHVEAWIFDLDNTLYPSSANLFAQIDVRMGEYIQRLLDCDPAEARRVQKGFFHSHGTTLSGLMEVHGAAPADFLDYVHDIDLAVLAEDRRVIEGVARLPGRKLVFTNGDERYARRVLARLGLGESFEAVHDIHATAYVPKPQASAYQGFCAAYAIDPAAALFVEDMAQNLAPAKALGMTTVWVNNGSERGAHAAHPDFIDFEIADVGDWLERIAGEPL
jgi:putative hydrolase of the HAD superfamily